MNCFYMFIILFIKFIDSFSLIFGDLNSFAEVFVCSLRFLFPILW